jgi:hypothetical protein
MTQAGADARGKPAFESGVAGMGLNLLAVENDNVQKLYVVDKLQAPNE